MVLALAYPLFDPGLAGWGRAFAFAGLAGLFYWSIHVLAFAAKQDLPDPGGFIGIETLYLIVQFALFAVVLGLVYPG